MSASKFHSGKHPARVDCIVGRRQSCHPSPSAPIPGCTTLARPRPVIAGWGACPNRVRINFPSLTYNQRPSSCETAVPGPASLHTEGSRTWHRSDSAASISLSIGWVAPARASDPTSGWSACGSVLASFPCYPRLKSGTPPKTCFNFARSSSLIVACGASGWCGAAVAAAKSASPIKAGSFVSATL